MEVYKPSLILPLGRIAIIVFSLFVCYNCILRTGESNPLYYAGIISSIASVVYQVNAFRLQIYMSRARELDISTIKENAVDKESL